jgi:hypothetical protein
MPTRRQRLHRVSYGSKQEGKINTSGGVIKTNSTTEELEQEQKVSNVHEGDTHELSTWCTCLDWNQLECICSVEDR